MWTRRDIKTVQTFLRSGQRSRPFKGIWATIYETWQIGHIEERAGKRWLNLNDQDCRALRCSFERDQGVDPLTLDLSGDRMDHAEQGGNEKWSAQAVFGGMLWVASRQAIAINGNNSLTAADSFLAVSAADIAASDWDCVVAVENGAAFRRWHEIELTLASSVLFIYRGHDKGEQVVNNWLEEAAGQTQRYAFYDLDPAGLRLAAQAAQFDGLLIPDSVCTEQGARELRALSRFDKFADQRGEQIANYFPRDSRLFPIAQRVHDHRLALMQETIITNRLELSHLAF